MHFKTVNNKMSINQETMTVLINGDWTAVAIREG
jgi:hypothetical protein